MAKNDKKKPVQKKATTQAKKNSSKLVAPSKAQPVVKAGKAKGQTIAKPTAKVTNSEKVISTKTAAKKSLAKVPEVNKTSKSTIDKKPEIQKTIATVKAKISPILENKKPVTKSTTKTETPPPTNGKTRYSDKELAEFKLLIDEKLTAARKELNYLQEQIVEMNENNSDIQGSDWFDDSSIH
nr:hypothetical protein [Saprospiraceae bacterium]